MYIRRNVSGAACGEVASPYFIVRESDRAPHVLEMYFNDIYRLFLQKLSDLNCSGNDAEAEKRHLRALLDELISVKAILQEEKDRG